MWDILKEALRIVPQTKPRMTVWTSTVSLVISLLLICLSPTVHNPAQLYTLHGWCTQNKHYSDWWLGLPLQPSGWFILESDLGNSALFIIILRAPLEHSDCRDLAPACLAVLSLASSSTFSSAVPTVFERGRSHLSLTTTLSYHRTLNCITM